MLRQKIVAVLKLIRWFHELLAILPFISLYFVIGYFVGKEKINCDINGIDFLIVCLGVQLLLAAGCVHNDIADRHIDKVNKPNTHIIDRIISLKFAKQLFLILSCLAILVSVYISHKLFIEWSWISITVYILSFIYNQYLKRSPLFGNILMAGLAAFIPLVVLFFAKDCIVMLQNEKVNTLIYIYALFPFLVIIPRELSLDISDIDGDRADGCRTLPIVIGIKKSRFIVVALIILTIICAIIMMIVYPYMSISCAIVTLLLLCYLLLFRKIKKRIEYIRLNRFLWATMILGLISSTIATIMT